MLNHGMQGCLGSLKECLWVKRCLWLCMKSAKAFSDILLIPSSKTFQLFLHRFCPQVLLRIGQFPFSDRGRPHRRRFVAQRLEILDYRIERLKNFLPTLDGPLHVLRSLLFPATVHTKPKVINLEQLFQPLLMKFRNSQSKSIQPTNA